MVTSSTANPHVTPAKSTGWTRDRTGAPGRPALRRLLGAALAVALCAVGATAFATPTGSAPGSLAASPASPNLGLDARSAVRLLAEADGKASEAPADDAKPADKSSETKLTGTKGGDAPKQAAAGQNDTFAVVKDWPFWAIVGSVIIVGASVYMIDGKGNQEHSCPGVYNAGCFGAK
jgi:hypothetical protein